MKTKLYWPFESFASNCLRAWRRALVAGAAVCTLAFGGGGSGARAAEADALGLAVRTVKVGSGFATTDSEVLVPIELAGIGNEGAVSFSLQFDRASFEYAGFTPGQALAGGAFFANTNEANTGRIGLALSVAPGSSFPASRSELGTLRLKPLQTAAETTVTFADSPIGRELVSTEAIPLLTGYRAGSAANSPRALLLAPTLAAAGATFEQEVQVNGSGSESAFGFTIEYNPEEVEFFGVRALISGASAIANSPEPASGRVGILVGLAGGATLAPGLSSVAMIQFQAKRIGVAAVRLSSAVVPLQAADALGRALPVEGQNGTATIGQQRLHLPSGTRTQGESFDLPVQLVSLGHESAASFSIRFDTEALTFESASLGADLAGGELLMLDSSLAHGRLGFAVSALTGKSLQGGTREIARLRFVARGRAGNTQVEFSSSPTRVEVADLQGGAVTNLPQEAAVITLAPAERPVILAQPSDREASPGSTVEFRAAADGAQPLFFQWRKDDLEIFRETNSSLVLNAVSGSDSGRYSVEVRNHLGAAVSRAAQLVVVVPPLITNQPQPAAVLLGRQLSLGVSALGTPPLSFEWFRNAATIPGATSSNYFVKAVSAQDDGIYTVRVGNRSEATVVSAPARVTVVQPPTVLSPPTNTTVLRNQPFELRVQATGSEPLRYQWRHNGQNINNATSAVYRIEQAGLQHAGLYTVVVANDFESLVSAPAELIVTVEPAPPQDNFSNARPLVGDSGSIRGTNLSATREQFEPNHAGRLGTNSVWFRWRSAEGGRLEVKTLGSSFDTLLAAYVGNSLGNLQETASDDDSGPAFTSRIVFNTEPNASYAIALDGFISDLGLSAGNYVLSWDFTPGSSLLPEISKQPESATLLAGSAHRLEVAVSPLSGAGLTYRWFFNGQPVSGASGPSLLRPAFGPEHVGDYAVEISNPAGLTTRSATATLEIGPDPDVRSQDKTQGAAGPVRQSVASSVGGAQALLVAYGTSAGQVYNQFNGNTQQLETNACPFIGGKSKWLRLQAAAPGVLVVRAESSFETILSIRDGNNTRIVYAFDCASTNHRLELPARAGDSFLLLTESASDGVVSISASLGEKPKFESTEFEETDLAEGDLELRAPAVLPATPKPEYQWFLDGIPLPNSNLEKLRVTRPGEYSITVRNAVGEVSRTVAKVSELEEMKFESAALDRSAGALRFRIMGGRGQSYRLRSTSDFQSWMHESEGWIQGQPVDVQAPMIPTVSHRLYSLGEKPLGEGIKISELTDGAFNVAVSGGRFGQKFVLERKDGDGRWFPIQTNTIRGATFTFRDAIPGGGVTPSYRIVPR